MFNPFRLVKRLFVLYCLICAAYTSWQLYAFASGVYKQVQQAQETVSRVTSVTSALNPFD